MDIQEVDMADTEEIIDGEVGSLALVPTIEAPLVTQGEDVFHGLSVAPITAQQTAVVLCEANPDELDILPTGEVYPPQVNVRLRLIEAFGPAGWGMRPLSKPHITENVVVQEWALYINGNFVSYTIGGAEYQSGNKRLNWSDALESLKSNALVRLCKDLGMFHECWDKHWVDEWKRKYTVNVWCKVKTWEKGVEVFKNKTQWRRADARPLWNETGIAKDSPNKDKYVAPSGGVVDPETGEIIDSKAGSRQSTKAPVTPSKADIKDNGQPPKEPAPVTPAHKPIIPATKAEPVPEPTTAQEPAKTNAITVSIWNGTTMSEKPALEAIDEKAKNWFVGKFIGKDKLWEYAPAFWGSDKSDDKGKVNPGHLGKHFGRHNLIDPKSPFTYDQFASLVGYCWHKLGDPHGWLDPRYYQDKIDEEAKKVAKDTDSARTDPNAIVTRASLMLIPIVKIAKDAYAVEWQELDTARLESLSTLLDMVESGKVGREDFDKMIDMLKAG